MPAPHDDAPHGAHTEGAPDDGAALLLDAASHRATINLLKDHLRTAPIRYTGHNRDANRLAHIQPLYVRPSFVLAHLAEQKI